MTNKEAIQYLKIAHNHILRKLGKTTLCEAIDLAIKALEERPTAHWINMKADDLRINDYQCSNCGNWSDEGKEYFPFCWRCGADMRGGKQ